MACAARPEVSQNCSAGDAAAELLRRLPDTETKTESSAVRQFGLGGAGKTDEPVIVVAHSRDS